MRNPFFHICAVLTLLFTAAVFVSAQDTAISAEKKAVIAEMITVLKADKYVEETMRAVVMQFDAGYATQVEEMINKRPGMSPTQKKQIASKLIRDHAESSKMQERLLGAIDYHEFVELTLYPIYDKFFTESELRDLLAFYRSPTGQKMTQVMPQLAMESVRLTQEVLLPRISAIITKLIEQDIAGAQTSLTKPPTLKN